MKQRQHKMSEKSVQWSGVLLPPLVALSLFFVSCSSQVRVALPLNALGPDQIGPVSCHLDPQGDREASYSSDGADGLRAPIGSPLGAAWLAEGAAQVAEAPGQAQVNQISRSAGYFEGRSVLANMRREFAKAGYKVKDSGGSKFLVQLSWYGIWKKNGGLACPLIRGGGKLYDTKGGLIWSTSGSAWLKPKRTLEDYKANPQLYKSDFEQASRTFAAQLVKNSGVFSEEYLQMVRQ